MNMVIRSETTLTRIHPVPKFLFGGLLIYFIIEYIRPGAYFPVLEIARLNTIVPFIIIFFTLITRNGQPNTNILKAKNTKWFIFFLCLFPIQIFTADVTLYVFNTFKAVLGFVLIYFVIIKQITSMERMKALLTILVLIHIGSIILNPNVFFYPEQRNYSLGAVFLGDGNDYAWSACIVIPFALFLAQSSKGKLTKGLFWSVLVLLTLSVIGTQSRGGSIALATLVIYLVLRSKKKALGLLGLGALVTVVFLFAPQSYFDRMRTMKDYETEGSAQGRIMAWKSAVRMAVDHPFIGVGAGHFAVKYGVEYRPPGVGRTELPWSNAHSIYFVAIGEFGFTGAFLLLGIILSNIGKNEKSMGEVKKLTKENADEPRKLLLALQAGLIGFAVGGAFLSGLYYPHLYVLAALTEAGRFIIRSNDSNKVLEKVFKG